MNRLRPEPDQPIPADLTAAEAMLRPALDPCGDICFRSLVIEGDRPLRALLIYSQSMVKAIQIDEQALASLMLQLNQGIPAPGRPSTAGDLATLARQRNIPLANPQPALTVQQGINEILRGSTALLVDGCHGALLFRVPREVTRGVSEPLTEGVVRGPREGFTEDLETNLTLVRRRLAVRAFRLERQRLGERTQTEIALLFLDGLADPQVVEEVRRRLSAIQISEVLDSAYVEEMIEDAPFSPFPTVAHTERPDKVAAALLEGQVALITSGSPQVLLMPITLTQLLQSAEDYYERYYIGSAIRVLRLIAGFFALTLPSFYVAVTTYHHEMIPSPLFHALAAQREGVPWPAVLEAFLMEIAFELLREAGIRLPRPVGQAISIIGGLVIGEAAIRARIASAGMVIIVATTGICSYVIPAYNLSLALRFIRFPMMLLGASLGLHGVVVGLLLLLIHLLNLTSFGTSYLRPALPAVAADWKDTILRAPWWHMRRRNRRSSISGGGR
ncbi:MAG TPA: spore germination protein [Symbiobacteriaceae bacterium]|nr:spore germination protein [Symbiobacteriaceae bacterium]